MVFNIARFIRSHNIFTPNGSKSITEIELGDIVVLGKQLCRVTKISGPYSTTLPMDSDKSANPKKAIALTGQSILWPKIEYDHSFLHHDDNKIGTLSGEPDMYAGDLIAIKNGRIEIRDEDGETHSLALPDNAMGRRIQLVFGWKHRLEVMFESFMGIEWASDYVDYTLLDGDLDRGGGPPRGTGSTSSVFAPYRPS